MALTPVDSVLVVGELNADAIAAGLAGVPRMGFEVLAADFALTLGSASAIFASGMAKLGHPTALVSLVGDDELGRFCTRELEQLGVDVSFVKRSKRAGTGITLCFSGKSDRAQVTYLGAIGELALRDVPKRAFRNRSHLHLTSYALQHALRPSFGELMRQAKRRRMTVSFDPNSDLTGALAVGGRRLLALSDIVFMNELEATRFTRTSSAKAALDALSQLTRCAVVKLGRRGAIASLEGKVARAPGLAVKAVDTTGAGDSFAAGFVSAFVGGADLATCLRWGNACGALSTRCAGGTPGQPTRPELLRQLSAGASGAGRARSR